MFSRRAFSRSTRLKFAGVVLADKIEQQLDHYYSNTKGTIPILLDFQSADFIDIAALVNCIAVLVYRLEKGYQTYIGYPSSKAVRDFLNVWRFREAIEAATQLPFEEFLLPEDHKYLNEIQITYDGIGNGIDALEFDPDWDGAKYSKRNFFEFTTFFSEGNESITPEGPFYSAPRIESGLWTSTLIMQVLEKHLIGGRRKDDIARVVIYEALSNAIRHPKAAIIQSASVFHRKPIYNSKDNVSGKTRNILDRIKGTLRICIWDDGDIIAETLQKPLLEGKPVRAFSLPLYMYENIHVKLRTFHSKRGKEQVVDQSEDPNSQSAEARLLLSSLYPGITRTIAYPTPTTESFDDQLPVLEAPGKLTSNPASPDEVQLLLNEYSPGMGLYALTKVALDQFQGTLYIRSGNYFLIIEVAHDKIRKKYNARYECKIKQYPNYYPPFRGNLLIIQLPIKD